MSKLETRPTTELERDVFKYLNNLRDSGVTNMFGAAPYVADMFDLNTKESSQLLGLWMNNFDPIGNYQTIKI